MANLPARCDRCNGNLIRDGAEIRCLQCGNEYKSLKDKHRFYNDHQQEILKDIRLLGAKKTSQKWQMPSSTLSGLLSKWSQGTPFAPTDSPAPHGNDRFPNLPPWSDTWEPEVQTRWLDVYELIITHSLKEVPK